MKVFPSNRFRAFVGERWAAAVAAAALALASCWAATAATEQPLRLRPENPRCFLGSGRPAVLITAGEHCGAVLNFGFEFITCLDELARHRFNLTRIFSGTYREGPGSFNLTGNTLAPAPGRCLCPWGRSDTPGAAEGGNPFDLTQWDARYSARWKDCIRQANPRGVGVELVFFGTMDAIDINGGTRAELELDLPDNPYRTEGVKARSGQREKTEPFSPAGGTKTLAAPVYAEDLALRILGRTTHEVGPKATGPLRPHPTNPRYFTDGTRQPDGSLKAVYLTGSHTWSNLIDRGPGDPPPAFDFSAYLDFLQKHHHNFIRLWSRHVAWYHDYGEGVLHAAPLPWMRTGPGIALDGKPKWDLTTLDPAYFDRLRKRVTAARDHGVYVALMLFGGHYECHGGWRGHPFHAQNNIHGIDGDPTGDGVGLEAHTLAVPAITRLQEAYVRQVIDTVNDCDNVLYEIANEADEATMEWQTHLIRFIHHEEAGKPRQHPVGMTALWTDNAAKGNQVLAASPADWIAPHTAAWGGVRNLPAADGAKVSLLDSDHWFVKEIYRDPVLGRDWVWRAFCRGHNPILMEHLAPLSFQDRDYPLTTDDPGYVASRRAMGQTRRLAERMNLAAMTPRGELASSGYCLVNPGTEYLVFVPGGGEVTVDLTPVSATLAVEWLRLTEADVTQGAPVRGGAKRTLTAPFAGDAAVHLHTVPPGMESERR